MIAVQYSTEYSLSGPFFETRIGHRLLDLFFVSTGVIRGGSAALPPCSIRPQFAVQISEPDPSWWEEMAGFDGGSASAAALVSIPTGPIFAVGTRDVTVVQMLVSRNCLPFIYQSLHLQVLLPQATRASCRSTC